MGNKVVQRFTAVENKKQSYESAEEKRLKLERHRNMILANRNQIRKKCDPFRYDKNVYRLKSRLPMSAPRILYPFKKKELDELRSKGRRKRHRAKKRSKKNMLVALLLLLLIVCVVGVGTFFIYQVLTNKESNRVVKGDVIFVNEDSINVPIENARLNKDIDKLVRIRNETNASMYVRFKVDITDEFGKPATGKLLELSVRYSYDMSQWYFDSGENYLYYKGALNAKAEAEPITKFQIYTVNQNENEWAGKKIGVKFTVEIEEKYGSHHHREQLPVGWSSGWKNIVEKLT